MGGVGWRIGGCSRDEIGWGEGGGGWCAIPWYDKNPLFELLVVGYLNNFSGVGLGVGRNGWCRSRSINITAMIHKEINYTPVTAKSNSSKIWFTDKQRNPPPTPGILIRGPGFLFRAIKRLFLQSQKHNGGMNELKFMNFNGYWSPFSKGSLAVSRI